MKQSFTYLFIFLFCLLNSTLFASDFQLEESPFVTTFEKTKRMILVEGQIDDQTGYFLLDTGADDLILNRAHFEDYESFENLGKYRDVNGRKKDVAYLFVDSFRWGSLSRSKFYVQQLDFSGVEGVFEKKILGLIGFEVFRDFEMIIDYDKEEIMLSKLNQKGDPIARAIDTTPSYSFDFFLNEHLPTLHANFGEGQKVKIVLDSGSSINILDRKWRKGLADAAQRKNRIRFMGANSSRKVRDYYTLEKVDVQDQFAIRYWKAAVGKLDHFENTEIFIDGIMGINFFEIGRVGINYRQRQIHVWPNDNARHWRYVDLNENLVRNDDVGKPVPASNQR